MHGTTNLKFKKVSDNKLDLC